MDSLELTRRQLLLTTACGTALLESAFARSVAAQDALEIKGFTLPVPPKRIGELHTAQMNSVADALGETPLLSREGLMRMVDRLVESKLLTKQDGEILKALIAALFDKAEDVDQVAKQMQKIYDDAVAKATELGVAICSIASASIERARKLDLTRATYVVAADVSGALTGAGALQVFGPHVAIAGAIAGAVSGSAAAWYGSRPSTV